jgi:hypothetical protein
VGLLRGETRGWHVVVFLLVASAAQLVTSIVNRVIGCLRTQRWACLVSKKIIKKIIAFRCYLLISI